MTTINDVRAFWNQRPCNVRHSRAPVGSALWSREVTNRKYLVEPHIPRFAQFARWRDKSVLEIGCGIGTDTLEFLRAGASIDAVDLSQESVRLARQRLAVFDLAHPGRRGACNIYCDDAERRLPKGPYDLVYSFGVLHHTPCPGAVLSRAHDVMKDDAELRIMLYARRSYKNWRGLQPEAQLGCPIARTYTAAEVRDTLEALGFHVVSIKKTHIFPYRIPDYVEHRYVVERKWRWMPKFLFHLCERLMGWHLLIVAKKA